MKIYGMEGRKKQIQIHPCISNQVSQQDLCLGSSMSIYNSLNPEEDSCLCDSPQTASGIAQQKGGMKLGFVLVTMGGAAPA